MGHLYCSPHSSAKQCHRGASPGPAGSARWFTAGTCGCTFQLVGSAGGDTCLGHCRRWEDLILGPDSECDLHYELVLLRHYTCGTVVFFSLYILFPFPLEAGAQFFKLSQPVRLVSSLEAAGKGEFEHKHRVQAITPISIPTFRSGQISRGICICLLEQGLQEEHRFFSTHTKLLLAVWSACYRPASCCAGDTARMEKIPRFSATHSFLR